MNWTQRPLVLSERTLRRGWETAWTAVVPFLIGTLTWLSTTNIWLTLITAAVFGVLFFQIARPRFEAPPTSPDVQGNTASTEPVWAQIRWESSPRVPRVAPVVALADTPGGQVRQIFRVATADAPTQLRADGIPFEAELVNAHPPVLRLSNQEVVLRQERPTPTSTLENPTYDDPPNPPITPPLTQWWQRLYSRRATTLLNSDPQWIPVRMVPTSHTPWVIVRPSDGHVLARQYLPAALKGLPNTPHSALMGVPRGSAVLDENEPGDYVDGVLYGQGWSNPVLLRGIRIRHVG